MSANSIWVAPSGECLRSKGRYGSCGWQIKLCDPLAIGPYLSALDMRYHDEALCKSMFLTFTFWLLHFLTLWCRLYVGSWKKCSGELTPTCVDPSQFPPSEQEIYTYLTHSLPSGCTMKPKNSVGKTQTRRCVTFALLCTTGMCRQSR